MTERLPELLDAKGIQAELGVTRAAAEGSMRQVPIVSIKGRRKTYVPRSDLIAYLAARTFQGAGVGVSPAARMVDGTYKCPAASARPGPGNRRLSPDARSL